MNFKLSPTLSIPNSPRKIRLFTLKWPREANGSGDCMHAYMHVCIIVCMYVNLIDLSQRGLFRAYETDYWNKFNRLRIPAGRKHWPVGHVQIHLRNWTKGYLKQIHQVVREGLHLRISRFQIQCPNQSLMLPRLQLLGEVCNMTQKNQSKKKKK